MGRVVQINPTAEALHVSPQFGEVLYEFAQDFELKYCWLDPDPDVIDALKAIEPSGDDEVRAIRTIVELLEAGEEVEILYGY